MRVDDLQVEIHEDQSRMARAAAAAAGECLRRVLAGQEQARVVFACAASQVRFLEGLRQEPEIQWSRVVCFHMDEYLGITREHPASFRRFLREHLVAQVEPAAFESIEGEADQPLLECARYAARLTDAAIDLCVLGIGENGHLAFNDPPVADFSDPSVVKIVRLDLECRRQQVGEGAFPTLESVPQYAYTLTVPALCEAHRMLCVVPEKRKARAVKQALQGVVQTGCPASVLRRQPHAVLYLDEDSASGL